MKKPSKLLWSRNYSIAVIIRSHLYFLFYFCFILIFDSNDGPQILRSVFNISTVPRTRHLRNPYTAIEAFISNTRDAKVVKIEHRFTFADKLERFGAYHVTHNKEWRLLLNVQREKCRWILESRQLGKKYSLMELQFKKKKKLKRSILIFYLVHFFCVLAARAVIPNNSSTKAILLTVCCLREYLSFSLFVVCEKIFIFHCLLSASKSLVECFQITLSIKFDWLE